MLALVTGTVIAPSALSCNLAPENGDLRTQILRAHRKASVVVLARVVTAGFQGPLSSPLGESPTHQARLEVIEAWKGKQQPGDLIRTFAATAPGTCAVVLTPGETHLLYLRNREPYDVSLSHRNAKLDVATQEIEILRSLFGKASS
jgi:hypothetical protein